MCRTKNLLLIIAIAAGVPALANDVVFLNGRVHLEGGAAAGRAVEIQLSCKGSDHPVRQTMTNKKGEFYLRVERDEFSHVVRALPATAVDVQNEPYAGLCHVTAALPGHTSTSVDLATFTIGKDLKLPDLVLTSKTPR
jgi:hypothetical protein